MSLTIPYMGTKKYLSTAVLMATNTCKPGVVVDLFAGMGSVAEAHKGVRQVWANDAQYFASLNNKCRLTHPDPVLRSKIDKRAEAMFQFNMSRLGAQTPSAPHLKESMDSSVDFASFLSAIESCRELAGRYGEAYCGDLVDVWTISPNPWSVVV